MPSTPTPRNHRYAFLFCGLLAILIFNGIFLYINFDRVRQQSGWVDHTSRVINRLDLVLSSIKDAELGVRGFALTGNSEFLSTQQRGIAEAWSQLGEVEMMVGDNPLQQSSIKVFRNIVKNLFELNAALVKSAQQNVSPASLENAFAQNRSLMETVRSKAAAIKEVETGLLAKRTQAAETNETHFYWALALTSLFSVLIMSLAFYQFKKNHERSQADLKLNQRESFVAQSVSDLGQTLVGDQPLEQAALAALRVIAKQNGSLAAKLFIADGNNLQRIAELGTLSANHSPEQNANEAALLREALAHGEIQLIDNLPEEYWKIASSLGEARPQGLVMVPFRFQGSPLGIIELASFQPTSAMDVSLLKALQEPLGVGMNAVMSRSRLQTLLEKTQFQSEELQAQQEELRANNEELEQQARALESQQQSLNLQNRELEGAKSALQGKADELTRSSQYKSDFLAKMSHELRTPLNGLLILSTLLTENKENNLTDKQKQFAQSIHDAGRDLLLLINDILDLSKIEARKLSLKAEEFSLASVLEGIHTAFSPQTADKKLNFVVQAPEHSEQLLLFTDRQRLEQVLRNFLSNALKFTEQGTITLSAEITASGDIHFKVIDTGIGIPHAKQALIFDAFEQADSSVSRQYGGTGLGLTISRELAALLGGHIEVQSQQGEGSTFAITIPRNLPGSTEESSSPKLGLPSSKVRVNQSTKKLPATTQDMPAVFVQLAKTALTELDPGKRNILIVEDDEKFRQAVVEAAISYGFQPIEAGDGEVAMAILQEHTPDAVLLDIKLPGVSGLGLLEMIKQLPHLRHIPVHMISALDYQHNALRMGASGYLTKPVTLEKIKSALERIENLISQKVRRLLLIEDDARQSHAICELIAGDDVVIENANTGRLAIEKLKETSFDCIILDLSLPDVSGFDLLSELNSLEISLPPIVIYTGKDLSPAEETYLRRYSESIIIKGARSPERLLDEVNLFLHRVESMLPQDKRAMLTNLRSQSLSFGNKTVLLVDDDLRNVFALTHALEEKGLNVRIAKNGIEALEALDAHSDINLVLMDIMMPKMNGFEAMERIRKHSDTRIKSLPIVALTAKAMREDHERCIQAGASDYLPKPINLNNLFSVIKVWLTPKDILS